MLISPPRSKARGHRSGFTLIELMVVVVLIGLALAMATAQFDFILPEYELRGAAREAGYLLKTARSEALSSGKDVYMVYDLPGKSYWLLVAHPNEDTEDQELDSQKPPSSLNPRAFTYVEQFRTRLSEDVKIHSVILGKDRTVTSGVARVRIAPFGMSEHHIVNFGNSDGQQLSLRFNGFTGFLSFDDKFQSAQKLLEDDE